MQRLVRIAVEIRHQYLRQRRADITPAARTVRTAFINSSGALSFDR